jgi:predicted N-acetyltransferase YhbS
MLAVEESQRKCGLGTILVQKAIDTMTKQGADEVVLETEDVNKGSQKLYQRLGFLPTKHLHRYYLNGNGALRLALYLTDVKKKILQRPSPGSAASFSKDQYGQYQGYPHNEGGYGEGQYDDDLYG